MARAVFIIMLVGAVLTVGISPAQAQISMIRLPYDYDALEPYIDNQTMLFHHGRHYSTYINNTNNATAGNATLEKLTATELVALVGKPGGLPANISKTIRNNAGGAWNHALFWKVMAPPGCNATKTSSISPSLMTAINKSFKSVDGLKTEMTTAATKVFGSGWAWLAYDPVNKTLLVTSTPNQDNPLMGSLNGTITAPGVVPILGLDVWEHAYYLKYGPGRPAYIKAWWNVVNWTQVSANFNAAQEGKVSGLVAIGQ